MKLTVTNYKDNITQKLNEYVRQVEQYKNDIAKLQVERMLLEKDLKIIDSKISAYLKLVTELMIEIEGRSQLMRVADSTSQGDANHSKVEFVKNIPDSVVAPPSSSSTYGLNENAYHSHQDNLSKAASQNSAHVAAGDVTSQEINVSESAVETKNLHVDSGNSGEYPLLNLLSSNVNDTKTVGRKAKYRLKQQYTGMGIAEAAESYMSLTPGQKYHVNDLIDVLYDGLNDSNALAVYKTLSTQLSLASKKKGRIKKHSNKATYYYS